MNLNELSKRVHEGNKKWWTDMDTGLPIERNKGELLMLVITELAEAVEGIRKNLMDDKLPHRKMEEVEMADALIRMCDYCGGFGITFEDQMVVHYFNDGAGKVKHIQNKAGQIFEICRCVTDFDFSNQEYAVGVAVGAIKEYCSSHNLDLEGAIEEKLAYNATRIDHTHEHRKSENGKKF